MIVRHLFVDLEILIVIGIYILETVTYGKQHSEHVLHEIVITITQDDIDRLN